MKKPKIVIFDEENNNVVCEEPMTLIALVCDEKQIKTIICGVTDEEVIKKISKVAPKLILETFKEGEKK